jgi:glycerophosphoryl diester phosphodiesterase
MEDYRSAVSSSDYIVHALGGEEDRSYINSIDILDKAYKEGLRVFEADISFTSDGVLVLAHSGEDNVWSKNDWEKRLGQKYPFDDESVKDYECYDVDKHLCSYEVFKSFKIQGRYTANSFAELLDYMEEHVDMYLMVDAGYRSYADAKACYEAIVEAADGRTQVLDRLIAGGRTTDMVKAAREAYDFPLINLYFDKDENRESIIYSAEDFVRYCDAESITSLSIAKEGFTEDVAKVISDSDLIIYVFTENDESEAEHILSLGADMVGTDFLWSEEKKN